jgi:predicted Zn finger-like uncharacterized protein
MTLAPNTMVTRCPKCGTAFRITATQLESAKGAVRCGSCLHIFKAQSHLVTKPEATKTTAAQKVATPAATKTPTKSTIADKPSAKPASKSATKSKLNLHDEDEDMLISDDMEEGASGNSKYEFDGFLDLETKLQARSLFDRNIKNEDDGDKKPKDTTDESWAENLIDEDDEDIPQITVIKKQIPVEPVKEPVKEIAKAIPAEPVADHQAEKNKLVFNLVGEEETPAQPSMDEFRKLILGDEISQITDTAPNYREDPKEKEEIINAIPVAGIFHDEDFQDTNSKRQLKIEPKIRAYDSSRSGLLKNIIPAPLELAANNMGYWYNRMLWPTLVVIALLSILLQLAYFRFDHFARIQPYRDFYAFACPVVGCTLPTLVDKKQLVTYNLVVQADDENPDALSVDVMLLNKAGFDQPFPDLLLSFSDMDGNIKASRRFKPNDYLGGELSGKKLIPSKQPIHISLQIKDPKLDNYKMDVL